jgi:large subunit ribosomal protein L30
MGLTKLNKTVDLEDTPSIRGMINKVCHMVAVEEVDS